MQSENPYRFATAYRLRDACARAVAELEERRRRSPAEKAAFAKDLRFLLLAVSQRLHGFGPVVPNTAEAALERKDGVLLSDAYWSAYGTRRKEADRHTRREILHNAAEYVLGMPAAQLWLVPSVAPTAYRPLDEGERSDEGLKRVLRMLEELYEARRGRGDHEPPPDSS